MSVHITMKLILSLFFISIVGLTMAQTDKLKVYPNPCVGSTTIDLSTPSLTPCRIQVFTIRGVLILSKNIHLEAGITSMHISGLKQGSYIVHAVGPEIVETRRILCRKSSDQLHPQIEKTSR